MFIRFWIKRYWMIEGSLKFHSEKMKVLKSWRQDIWRCLSCSNFEDLKVFRACDKEYDPNHIPYRLRSLKPRRTASLKTVRSRWSSGPRSGQANGWGWNWSNVSENIQETSKSFMSRKERKLLQGLYWSYSLSVDLVKWYIRN